MNLSQYSWFMTWSLAFACSCHMSAQIPIDPSPTSDHKTRYTNAEKRYIWCHNCKLLIYADSAVETIDIYDRRCYLPEYIFTLPKLTSLYISSAKLEIGKEASQLHSLRELSIHHVTYDHPPTFIFGNLSLRSLLLNLRNENSVIKGFSKLEELESLYLNFESLDIFPAALEELSSLKKLRITIDGDETLKQLNENFTHLSNLEQLKIDLDLSHNVEFISKLPRLKYLWVKEYSNFEDSYKTLTQLANLEGIYIDKISSEELKELKKLLPVMRYKDWPDIP